MLPAKLSNRIVHHLMLTIAYLCCSAFTSVAVGQDDTPLKQAESTPQLSPIKPAEVSAAGIENAAGHIQLVNAAVSEEASTPEPTLDEKQQANASKLRVAMLQEQAEKATTAEDAQPKANETEVDLLKQVDVILAQRKSAAVTLEDIRASEADAKLQLAAIEEGQVSEEPPYSIMLVDQLRDSNKSLEAKAESLQGSLLAARDAVERASQLVADKQRAARQFKEKNPEADASVPDLEVRIAEEMLELRRKELEIEDVSERVRKLQLAIGEKKLAIIRPRAVFTKQMLNQQIADLDAHETDLKRKVETLKTELQFAERRWLAARELVDATPTPGPELLERVDALKTNQQTIQQELAVANQRLQRLPMVRTAWERRFLVISAAASSNERRVWLDETVRQIDQLGREKRARELKIDEVRNTALGVNAAFDATPADKMELRRWLSTKQAALAKQKEVLSNGILAIDSASRTLQQLRIQIEGEKGRTVSEWLAETWSLLKWVWNYELMHSDDVSITVGEVLSSVLLFFLGFLAAKWISGLLARRLPKLGVDEAATSVIESLSFYVFLIAFGLAALKYANVPLTVFTFLGGAIAIGVGFGSQNILNNFISGLILLAERPIKKGDLIKLDDTYGNIVKIGARSTQVRTGENLDIVVPNSKFLENNVTNLTRKDDRLRTSITVGVAYGSPLDQVVLLLEQAANESVDVQERPKPMVWFNDFGDNSLVFQINFWIKARTLAQMRKIETDVRLNIDRLFRQHEIVIAFPQRDLHIQTPRPIELRLTGGNDEADGLPVRVAG